MGEDIGDGMQCINHPHTKNPGGICAFCLQDKLGKLVSSSFPLPKHPSSSSSSSSPSFSTSTSKNTNSSLTLSQTSAINNNNNKLPFLLAKKKKNMLSAASSSSSFSSSSANLIYRRSKSTTASVAYGDNFSPRKRSGFWSFLHLYSSKHHITRTNTNPTKKVDNFTHSRPRNQIQIGLPKTENQTTEDTSNSSMSKMVNGVTNKNNIDVIAEEEESPNKFTAETPISASGSSFGRKVSRSRSVGCGSRSFSGDFFERISNGFGDCALRRIESQREVSVVGGNKAKVSRSDLSNGNDATSMREMVRCGGIFGGFMIMASSSSWVSSSSGEQQQHHKMGNNKAWGWGFASPMRAKTCPSAKDEKRNRTITEDKNSNSSPNLDAIPSLLTVRS